MQFNELQKLVKEQVKHSKCQILLKFDFWCTSITREHYVPPK